MTTTAVRSYLVTLRYYLEGMENVVVTKLTLMSLKRKVNVLHVLNASPQHLVCDQSDMI